jgi:hypothetical protein
MGGSCAKHKQTNNVNNCIYENLGHFLVNYYKLVLINARNDKTMLYGINCMHCRSVRKIGLKFEKRKSALNF